MTAGDRVPPVGTRVLELVAVMDRLRSPGGCPWDAEQTHASLREYLLEEAYETLEALDLDDADGLREELGDLLLQVVFHARIAAEDPVRPWTIDDVATGITAKLIRRHPHVFADGAARTPEQVSAAWTELKRAEKGRSSVVDGVPMALPALALAAKLRHRAVAGGDTTAAVLPAKSEAMTWAEQQLADCRDEADLGPLFLALATAAADRGWDAESALRDATHGYRVALRVVEGDGAAGRR